MSTHPGVSFVIQLVSVRCLACSLCWSGCSGCDSGRVLFRAIFGLSRLCTLGKSLNGDLRRHSTDAHKEAADGALCWGAMEESNYLKVSFFWCSNWFKLIQTSHWWARARAGTPRRPSPWKVTQPLLRVSGHGKAEPSFIAEFRICLDHPRPSARRIREPFAACNFDFSFLMHFRQQVKWALLWSRILQGKWTLQLFEPLMISIWAWLPFRSCCHMLPFVPGLLLARCRRARAQQTFH